MAFGLQSIFGGGSKVPSFNPTPLRDILQQGANKQRSVVNSLPGQLVPFNTELQDKTNKIGQDYLTSATGRKNELVSGAVNPAATNAAIGAKQEQEFRGVPMQQQAIRDALASGNRLATGRGAAAIAQPVITAAQNVSDYGSNLNLQNEQNRQTNLRTGISYEQQADLNKLGLDEDTMKTLFETGRGDIVQQAADLLGIEGDLSQGLFNLENTRQLSDIAKAQADEANRNALRNALLGIGGNLAGIGLSKSIPQATAARG